MRTLLLLVLASFCVSVRSWDSLQLEVFDVVEEVKEKDFYSFLSVGKDADAPTIKAAFRRLSKELHPDKNIAENAEEQFRNLVSVYEVLKDPAKRRYYDEVLVNGLPSWRSAVFYYRKVRRIGLAELGVLLFVLITGFQYVIAWAAYFEQKYTMQVKIKKQRRPTRYVEEPQLLKPSFTNTLPIQIPYLVWTLILSIPTAFCGVRDTVLDAVEQYRADREEEASETSLPRPARGVRRRKPGFVVPDGPTFEAVPIDNTGKEKETRTPQPPPLSGGLWTDEDLAELVQLINKHPGGTPGRWEVIAESLGRSVAEVTFMANKVKSNGFRIPSQEDPQPVESKTKKKTKGGKLGEEGSANQAPWSQDQQRAMEAALSRFSKGHADRWDRIAEHVPGKSREECIARYKLLVEAVRSKKEQDVVQQFY